MELESYYDGVAHWSAHGKQSTTMINARASFRVRFTPPRAGTFMYHIHLHDQATQLSGGLYGPLIVVEREQNPIRNMAMLWAEAARGRRRDFLQIAIGMNWLRGSERMPELHHLCILARTSALSH